MGFKKSELLEEVTHKRIDFNGPDGKPNGRYLEIDFRKRAMPYGRKKTLMDNALAIQGNVKRLKAIGKELENKSLGEVETERLEAERNTILAQINQFNVPLVDYLGGVEKPGENDSTIIVRPPAIVKWDLLGDDDTPLPINRAEIEDLDEETVSFIAWQLLNSSDAGEEKGTS